MRASSKKLIIVLICLACLILTGCAGKEYRATVFAMDTVMQITVYAKDDSSLALCRAKINDVEKMLSTTYEDSITSRLNRGETVTAQEEFIDLLSDCRKYSGLTGGAFDITSYPVVRLWGFTTGEHRVPDQQEIDEAVSRIGMDNIAENVSGEVSLMNGAEIDFGAVAKGYLGDRIRDILSEQGVSSALIDLGGNITVIGKNRGKDWVIGIEIPSRDESGLAGTVAVSDTSVVTSGSYRRYFEENGKVYGHIMDPETGYPAENGLISVTIVSQDTEMADALSTGLYVAGLEEAVSIWKETPGFEAVFITDDGTVYVTEGLASCFTINKDYSPKLVIIEK